MTEPQTSRRTIVSGLAIGGVALPLLAACGGSGSSKASGSSDKATGNVKAGIKTSDIPVGGGKIFSDDQVVIAQPTQGSFKAFTAVCTHEKCVVASISGDDINCACHGSKFSLKDGSVVHGPATKPLKELGVTVSGDTLKIS